MSEERIAELEEEVELQIRLAVRSIETFLRTPFPGSFNSRGEFAQRSRGSEPYTRAQDSAKWLALINTMLAERRTSCQLLLSEINKLRSQIGDES